MTNVLLQILLIIESLAVLSQIIAVFYLVKLINKILSYSFPWDKLERLNNAVQTREGFSSTEDHEKFTSFKKSAEVGELPPEVVAPGLKKMRKTSGF